MGCQERTGRAYDYNKSESHLPSLSFFVLICSSSQFVNEDLGKCVHEHLFKNKYVGILM